jgi:biotin carboxylase
VGKRRLHILGAGTWQLPSIALAKSLGYRVLVTDVYRDRPGYSLADDHEVMDISDEAGTLSVARHYKIDGIVCDTTDVGVTTAAFVAEKLRLPGIGYEVARNFTSKHRMRELSLRAGLPCPRFQLVKSLDEALVASDRIGYPLIMKPIANQSSRGVHRIESKAGIECAFADARSFTRTGELLVEECLTGTEVTVESFCVGGRVHVTGISDKRHFRHLPTVASRLTYPPDLASAVMTEIRRINEATIRALGLVDGVTHAEYFVGDGHVTLVEIAARGGGSRIYSHIVPYLADFDVPRYWLRWLMSEALFSPQIERIETRAANLEFFDVPAGKVRSIDGLREVRELPGVHEVLLEFSVGDMLAAVTDDRSRHGLMLVFGDSREQVLTRSERVKAMLRVTVDPLFAD